MFGNLRTIRDLRRGSPTGRYLALGASVALGAAALLAMATPASAHSSFITATSACESATGEYVVTWTVRNDWAGEMTLTAVAATPTAITDIVTGAVVPAAAGTVEGKIIGTQRVPGTATAASLEITASWSDGFTQSPDPEKVTLAGTCAPAPPECVSAAAVTYTHIFNGAAGTATITKHGLPLCAGQKQSFTLVSYTAPAPGFALPQRRFDSATGVIDATHPSLTLRVDVPPCYTAVYLIWGTGTKDVITAGNPYADTTLGGTTAPGNRSTGPLGRYSGGNGACTTPNAAFVADCDGTITVFLKNVSTATLPAIFTVRADHSFVSKATVAPGKIVQVIVPALNAGDITVTADDVIIGRQRWVEPANCEATPGGTPVPTAPVPTVTVPTVTVPTVTVPTVTVPGTPAEPAGVTVSDSLPVTGQPITPVATAGIALTLMGAVLLLVSRKRPQRTN